MCLSTGRPTSGKVPIRFGTYSIRNGRNSGLEAALQGMSQANMDLGILQEIKLTDGIYTRWSAGYSVVATDAPSRHRSGVAIFYRSTPHFTVEAVENFRPNVIGFKLVMGRGGGTSWACTSPPTTMRQWRGSPKRYGAGQGERNCWWRETSTRIWQHQKGTGGRSPLRLCWRQRA